MYFYSRAQHQRYMPQLDGAVIKQRASELRELGKAQPTSTLKRLLAPPTGCLSNSILAMAEILQKFDLISLSCSLYIG